MSDESQLVPDAECYTLLKEKTFHFKWIINNFCCNDMNDDECMKSSLFRFNCSSDLVLEGCLKLYPNRQLYLGIGIDLKQTFQFMYQTKLLWRVGVRISLLNTEGKDGAFKKLNYSYKDSSLLESIISLENLNKEKNNLLPDDNLTVLCQFTWVEYTSLGKPNDIKYELIESKLNKDLIRLFENKENCDVTLVANGHEFGAHKCILTARSDYFAAMFEHEMAESRTNRVDLPDLDKEVLEEILHYIYTGKSPNISKMVYELLAASDVYRLENLKWMCENELYSQLSIGTAVKILILADLYRATKLKDQAINFISANAKHVIKLEEWQNMFKSHPHLITDVLVKATH